MGDLLREGLGPLANRIRVAFVYGSFASGKEKAGSESAGREVNPVVFPQFEFREKITPFLENVLQGPKLFLIGSPDELERLAPVRVARRA